MRSPLQSIRETLSPQAQLLAQRLNLGHLHYGLETTPAAPAHSLHRCCPPRPQKDLSWTGSNPELLQAQPRGGTYR